MHPKTLFRVLLKFAGVYLVIMSLLTLVPEAASLLSDPDAIAARMPRSFHVRTWTHIVVQLAAGLYLFFRSDWLVEAAFTTPHPCCPHCGYRVRSEQKKCPECGADLPTAPADDRREDG